MKGKVRNVPQNNPYMCNKIVLFSHSDGGTGVFRAGDPGYVPRGALMVESGIPGGSGS